MDYEKNYNTLVKQMNMGAGKNFTFNLNQNTLLLPFSSRINLVRFENGFKSILGEFSRIQFKKSFNENLDENLVIENILNTGLVKFNQEEDKEIFKILLEDYLNDKNSKLNPRLFLYLNQHPDEYEQKGENDIALFFNDVFFNDEIKEKFKIFLTEYDSQDSMLNLILDNFPELDDTEVKSQFIPVLNHIVNLFKDDFLYLLDYHQDYLLENIELIFAYYYFFYSTQLMLKINKDFDADSSIEKLYYILEWESVSKNRTTINCGYNRINISNKELLPQMYLIDELNILMGKEGLILPDIYKEFESLEENDKKEFLKYLKKWADEYHDARKIENRDYDYVLFSKQDNSELKNLTNYLYCGLSNRERDEKNFKGVSDGRRTRYAQNINLIGNRYFLKSGGFYGNVLYLSRDMLLFLTSICVKDKKMKTKDLFKEFKKRGILFDKHSRKEIINYLDLLNLIDKKSDSGDAQYVRPIL